MDKLLKPGKLNIDPNTNNAQEEWIHWYRTFGNFIDSLTPAPNDRMKLNFLVNFVGPNVYGFISECKKYQEAIEILKNLYVKPKNEIYARHRLATRMQEAEESLDEFFQALKITSKECNFQSVTAEQNRSENIRDAFITGLRSNYIRQRLLEKSTLSLEEAFDQARSIEVAQVQAESYLNSRLNATTQITQSNRAESNSANSSQSPKEANLGDNTLFSAAVPSQKCYFCGENRHKRDVCPAKNFKCYNCNKIGHFSRVCRSKKENVDRHKPLGGNSASICAPSNDNSKSVCASSPPVLSKATVSVKVNSTLADALIDTGSSESFVSKQFVQHHSLPCRPGKLSVAMASTSLNSEINEVCLAKLELSGHVYEDVKLYVMKNLCADVIIGHDILRNHSSLEMTFGGNSAPLKICGLAQAGIEPIQLFTNLTPNCKPIAIKSRQFSPEDSEFIKSEVYRMQQEGIIEESQSPWRAQVLVVKGESKKKRMVIDYSQTINRFTELDAYPLPKIETIVNEVAKYKFYSTIDLSSAYHQIPIVEGEKPYTAFEADGRLFQFKRIPFGVTNGVPAFQRVINGIISQEKLVKTKAYLDDITIGGDSEEEHDRNLEAFLAVSHKYNLTINNEKSKFRQKSINLLGYLICYRSIKPDPERLRPLMELPVPKDIAALRRAMGMFAHYANLIPKFSEKIQAFSNNQSLPLPPESIQAFHKLKSDISEAVKSPINDEEQFTVETDASDHALSATLSQKGRPVAFFSKSLTPTERKHPIVEKEAQAIVESLKHWRYYLVGRVFQLITDQKSVAYMFDNKASGKIKNEKIQRWRMELSCYKYNIVYRPGVENSTADTLSRVCSVTGSLSLKDIHNSLCHPGVTRLHHWVRTKNLPFSLDDIRKVTSSCTVCAELKPRFCKFQGQLIKATAPFERLNIDFKGPLPSSTRNKYILTVVDEFSRFPFAFPCADMASSTVIKHLQSLFYLFGMPSYVHSDRGTSFLSQEVQQFLNSCGIASSRTTPYNPRGNGQAERYNGIIWKTVNLALKTHSLHVSQWEKVLEEALHSIRSLLCTATNATPHERMFNHMRKSFYGQSLPMWLSAPGTVLLKKFNNVSKYSPAVEVVDLVNAGPQYARIRSRDGRESTVSLRHLAPYGNDNGSPIDHETDIDQVQEPDDPSNQSTSQPNGSIQTAQKQRPCRERRPPDFYTV